MRNKYQQHKHPILYKKKQQKLFPILLFESESVLWTKTLGELMVNKIPNVSFLNY